MTGRGDPFHVSQCSGFVRDNAVMNIAPRRAGVLP